MNRLTLAAAFLASWVGFSGSVKSAQLPNVIVIMVDDLGYGDVGCYGATKVKTPNVDRLSSQGIRFTDGHATSGTCTPSRYSFLTGQYAWRQKGTNILPGDASLIIDTKSATLPNVLRKAGYATGAVGKWHLGLGLPQAKIDWNKDISPGPNEVGFDYSWIIPATGDRVPCVYVENHRVVGVDPADPILVNYQYKVGDEPTGKEHPELLKMKLSHGHDNTIVNGISRIGFMAGGKAARWRDEDIADVLTKKAVTFIETNKDKPFFLYFATHDIHVPRAPHERFAGKSECGIRGDVIQQMDWSVGQVMETLDRLKLTDNTLVIFTSDNGPVVDDGYADGAVEKLNGHVPAGPLRGGKYSSFEGGTRVPFITRWPGKIKAGQTSAALVCQIDLMNSLATLAGTTLAAGAGPDSLNVLPALLGEAQFGRESLVEQGGPLAIRKGEWKLFPTGVGPAGRAPAAGARGKPMLFNLADDLAETKDVAAEHADKVKELGDLFQQIRDGNGTRPGV